MGAEDAAEGREGAAQEAAATEEAQEEPVAAAEEVAAATSEVAAKQDEPSTLTQEDTLSLDGTAEAEAPQSVCNTYFIHVCMHYIQCFKGRACIILDGPSGPSCPRDHGARAGRGAA